MVITDSKTGLVLFSNARIANGFFQRGLGLLFTKTIGENEALLFKNAPSIHTFFMRYCIDIIFLDRSARVIKVHAGARPFRVFWCWASYFTVETGAHAAGKKNIQIGQQFCFTPKV